MLSQVAVRAKRHEVRERIVPLLAALDLVVDLQVLE
jgi:predicted HTH domain antitoxin